MEGLSAILSLQSLPWYLINFLLLVIVARIFLYKPVIRFMNERKERMQAERDAIDSGNLQLKERLGGIDQEHELRMEATDKEVSDKLIRADEDAKAILQDAYDQAERILENARKAASEETAKAREELREEISRLSVRLAERILEREVKLADHQQLVDEFLDKVG